MAEGQKTRRIGSGMKPRGNKRVKPQKEENSMTEQSTVEGHETPLKDAIFEGQEGNKTPPLAETENEADSLQNLEESEAMVAHNEDLEAAMNESAGEVIDAEFNDVDEPAAEEWPTHCVHDNPVSEPCPKCQAADMGKAALDGLAGISADKKYAIGVDYGAGQDKGVMAVIKTGEGAKPDELMGTFSAIAIGLQPDGSTKVIVTIQEGYWEAVQQWAEADGVEVERWLSDRLYEYISTYGEPAKGR